MTDMTGVMMNCSYRCGQQSIEQQWQQYYYQYDYYYYYNYYYEYYYCYRQHLLLTRHRASTVSGRGDVSVRKTSTDMTSEAVSVQVGSTVTSCLSFFLSFSSFQILRLLSFFLSFFLSFLSYRVGFRSTRLFPGLWFSQLSFFLSFSSFQILRFSELCFELFVISQFLTFSSLELFGRGQVAKLNMLQLSGKSTVELVNTNARVSKSCQLQVESDREDKVLVIRPSTNTRLH